MFLRMENLPETKLIGKKIHMSLANDRTGELWRSFMPQRKNISNATTTDLFCVQVYDKSLNVTHLDPHQTFHKWAAATVTDVTAIPEGMKDLIIPSGDYAVFLHKGAAATGPQTFQYIFKTWLPASAYQLDDRPHFEILGSKYKNDDPASEEQIWIPVKHKV